MFTHETTSRRRDPARCVELERVGLADRNAAARRHTRRHEGIVDRRYGDGRNLPTKVLWQRTDK